MSMRTNKLCGNVDLFRVRTAECVVYEIYARYIYVIRKSRVLVYGRQTADHRMDRARWNLFDYPGRGGKRLMRLRDDFLSFFFYKFYFRLHWIVRKRIPPDLDVITLVTPLRRVVYNCWYIIRVNNWHVCRFNDCSSSGKKNWNKNDRPKVLDVARGDVYVFFFLF